MNKHGITLTVLAITIIIMLILLGVGGSMALELLREGNQQKFVTNMLLIQTKVKIIMENAAFNGDTSNYVGTKLKDRADKQTIANGTLTAAELEKDTIYVFDEITLESIGLR